MTSFFIVEKEKKTSRRVKWADHFGGKLSVAQDDIDGEETTANNETSANADSTAATSTAGSVSWSDRKKRDRLREKELLSKAK